MTDDQKTLILNRIDELDKQNLTIVEADAFLIDYLIKAMPEEIKKAYDKMIINKIPF